VRLALGFVFLRFHFDLLAPASFNLFLTPFPPQSAVRLNENEMKKNQLKEDQEECEKRLEKERDIYASYMFDLLAEEDNISSYIVDYVKRK
jgi:hypothetical protein